MAKLYFLPEVRYDFHCTDFHETHNGITGDYSVWNLTHIFREIWKARVEIHVRP
jgi:hypothetical protein